MENIRRIVIPEFMIGSGARFQAGNYAENLGAKNILVVTDRNVSEAGHAGTVIDILESKGLKYTVFDNVTPNPIDFEVAEGAEVFSKNRCDCIVAVGGGSPMDCAKGIAIVSSNGGLISDYEGVDRISEPVPPMVCIPTTAGTSADVSQFAIITNTKEHYKMAIISKMVVPDISLIDPETLLTMDAGLTAATGMDALSHAIEALVSKAGSPFTDLHAIDAVKLIFKYLPKCMDEPDNILYRSKVMRASLEAGIAFSNASLGAVHAMAHSLGGFLNLPHGECNAVLLPYVIRHNFSSSIEKYSMFADAIGFSGNHEDHSSIVDYIINKTQELNNTVGITKNISDMGVKMSDIQTLAEKAFNDPCMITNPKEMNLDELNKIFQESSG